MSLLKRALLEIATACCPLIMLGLILGGAALGVYIAPFGSSHLGIALFVPIGIAFMVFPDRIGVYLITLRMKLEMPWLFR